MQSDHRLSGLMALVMTLCFGVFGCNLIDILPDGDQSDQTDQDKTDDQKNYPESDYWRDLAAEVEAGNIPDTHSLILIAQRLQSKGYLKDLSRLDPLKSKFENIESANKGRIADIVRGK